MRRQRQGKECWRLPAPPEVGRVKQGFFPEDISEGGGPADALISLISDFCCDRLNFCSFGPPSLYPPQP